MILDRLFLWSSVPVAFICFTKPLNNRGFKTALWIHICISVLAWVMYVYIRYTYSFNKADPGSDVYTTRCVEYKHNGCGVIEYMPPRPPRRRILVFPGLMVSVRKMIREECILPFLDDSVVISFQVRGFGDSDLLVDISTQSMCDDCISQYYNFEQRTDKTLPVFFIGYSLGTFLSMQLLSNSRFRGICEKIVLVNGLFECKNVVSSLRTLAHILQVGNKQFVHKSRVPIFIIHSRNDTTVSPSESIELIKECRDVRSVEYMICDGNHSSYKLSAVQKERYIRALTVFKKGVVY